MNTQPTVPEWYEAIKNSLKASQPESPAERLAAFRDTLNATYFLCLQGRNDENPAYLSLTSEWFERARDLACELRLFFPPDFPAEVRTANHAKSAFDRLRDWVQRELDRIGKPASASGHGNAQPDEPSDGVPPIREAAKTGGKPIPPNGPEGGVRYWFDGKSVPLKQRIYQVVNAMEGVEAMGFEALVEAMGIDPVGDKLFSTWANRANVSLGSLNLPWKYSVDRVNRIFRKTPR